jgi:acyl-CoA synthetase (AMP-forming)/AMP-acid ligase II
MKGISMFIDFLTERFASAPKHQCLVWNDQGFTYSDVLQKVQYWKQDLQTKNIVSGSVVGLEGDFSPNSVALFLALVDHACIIVPQSNMSQKLRTEKDDIAQVEFYYKVDLDDRVAFEKTERKANHELYDVLKARKHPGLVLFSSGTSGAPKAAVHDFTFLLEKFKVARGAMTTLNFLLFDHWGGLNTLLHTLSNTGTTIMVRNRTPEVVCQLIEKYKIALLPATPTFLNLLLISGANKNYDLSSLKVITYGAEPMPLSTLERLKKAFPTTKLQQTYGLIEVGVLRSKSRDDGSLWVKIGGEGYETRVVDGILHIKTTSTILGYLNAKSPMSDDGWFITGDAVEVDGDYFKILGRKSEIINVGGEKVYPAEVESIIQEFENVQEVTVYGEKNPLIGSMVCAKIKLKHPEETHDFTPRLKAFCNSRMEKFKVPVKISIIENDHFGERFKKTRSEIAKIATEG